MSRRQILSASAVPSVAAMTAVFAPSQREDEDLKLWRDWNAAEVVARTAYDRYCGAADVLPEDERPYGNEACGAYVHIQQQRKAYDRVRAVCADDAARERADEIFLPILHSMERDQQRRKGAQVLAGLPALEATADRLQEHADRLCDQIEGLNSTSSIAVAAKLHAAMRLRNPDHFCDEYPFRFIISILRDLAEVLPDDMAAAIRATLDKELEEDTQERASRVRQVKLS